VSAIREMLPIMVLAEDTMDRQLYRFRGSRWAAMTLVFGLGLFAGCALAHEQHAPMYGQVGLAVMGVLMLYSSVFSLAANQWLRVDGSSRSITFHKKNIYGRIDWERPGDAFSGIRVFRPSVRGGKAISWSIVLVGRESPYPIQLAIGENELGSLHRERALEIARKVGKLAGIEVVES
jgi:hypothetical protein